MGGGCRVNIRTPTRSPINNVKDPLLVIPALLTTLSLSLSKFPILFYFLRGNFPQTAAPDFLTRKILPNDMKKTGILAAASVAAASASAISSSPSSPTRVPKSKAHGSRSEEANLSRNNDNSGASSDKFAPRFDGLRFIETLVTAHR